MKRRAPRQAPARDISRARAQTIEGLLAEIAGYRRALDLIARADQAETMRRLARAGLGLDGAQT